MLSDLIYDVGMHTGEDTAFYLKKGYRVAAIEANEALVEEARERFADEIDAGRLTIYPVAVAEHEGTVAFYRNEQKADWGTTSLDFVERNQAFGTTHTKHEVPCVPLERLIEATGVPFYAKIDVEGADLLCLRAFQAFAERPRYVSIEASLIGEEEVFAELSQLFVLGYRRFKIVNQAENGSVRCPQPALHGLYVDQRFDGHSSGPFGEEAPGAWCGVAETFDRYRRILRRRERPGWRRRGDDGWYDLHAALDEEDAR